MIGSQTPCVFASEHTHPTSKLPIGIRHHAVLLDRGLPLDEAPSRPAKHVILFLAANPIGMDPRAFDRQARAIRMELEHCGYRDRFELVTRWAAEPLDLLRELRKLGPSVVHFSGHGSPNAAGDGLVFQDAAGAPRIVSTRALAETFGAAGVPLKLAGVPLKLIVLDACYSKPQAEALLAHSDCVVGMAGVITDEDALRFAIGLYGGLGDCASIAAAYKQGCAAISLDGRPGGARPQLLVREGVDAEQIVLAADSR